MTDKIGSSLISSGSSLIGGVLGALTASSAAKRQYNYQRKLNEQAQQYAVENATTAYNRQRELTQDNALLQLQGNRKAGLSTAFGEGSSVGGASSVQQANGPSSGAAPNVPTLAESFNEGSQAMAGLLDLATKRAEIQKLNSETVGQNIQNDFDATSFLTRLSKLESENKSSKFKARVDELMSDWTEKYGEIKFASDAQISKNNALITGVQAQFEEKNQMAELDRKIEETNKMVAERYKIIADTNLSQKEYEKAVQEIKNLQEQIKVYQAQIQELKTRSSVNVATAQSINNNNKVTGDPEYIRASIKEKVLSLVPANAASGIMRTKPFMDYINKLERGEKLTSEEIAKYRLSLQQILLTEHPDLKSQVVSAVVNGILGIADDVAYGEHKPSDVTKTATQYTNSSSSPYNSDAMRRGYSGKVPRLLRRNRRKN
jgi:hypothetical protein